MSLETDPILPPSEVFTKRELARLEIYRIAVDKHFYTDECQPTPNSRTVAELLHQPTSSLPSAPEIVNGDMKAPNSKPGTGT